MISNPSKKGDGWETRWNTHSWATGFLRACLKWEGQEAELPGVAVSSTLLSMYVCNGDIACQGGLLR